MEAATWAFVGTVVGAITSIATTTISNWNNFRIQKLSTSENRIERSRAFQRETLIELQTEILAYLRLISLAHLEVSKVYHKDGNWGVRLSEELDEKIRLSNEKSAILIERVMDDELRNKLDDLKTLAMKCLCSGSKEKSESYRIETHTIFFDCNKQLGTTLRNYY